MSLRTIFLRVQQYSADYGYPLATLRTAHPSFCPPRLSYAASNISSSLPLFALFLPSSELYFPSPAYSTAPIALKAADGVNPKLPRWPAWWLISGQSLHKFLAVSLLCSTFFNIITNSLFHNSSKTP